MFDLLADTKYLGVQPGMIAALHTWSQTLVLHPHVHCLVTGVGGLRRDTGTHIPHPLRWRLTYFP